MRDRQRRRQRRKHHRDLHQQRHLRHDRRPDGPDEPARTDHADLPYGRDVKTQGYPIRICELLATLDAPAYLARVTVNKVKNVKNAKACIKKAFENQIQGKGFSLVEVLSACPTNWGLEPQKALEWIDEDDPVLSARRVPR